MSGKHKRGERGSTEEENQSSPKRANMVTEGSIEDSNEEPSRMELKEMLVDIKIEISSILRVNNNLVKEVAELRIEITAHKSEIDKLKTSLEATKKRNKTLENDITAARKTIDEQDEEIAELYDLQDKLEQYTRKQSLEIHGIPEVLYSTTEEAVLKIAEKLDVPIEPEDINISHTIKGKGIKPILVKFYSHKTKTKLYRARTKLKNIKVSDIFPHASAATRVVAEKNFHK